MEKYLFTPVAETMAANGKDKAALDNLTANVMGKYGAVEPYKEPIVPHDEIYVPTHTTVLSANDGFISEAEYRIATLRAEKAEQELDKYTPLINIVKAMTDEYIKQIESLGIQLKDCENANIELGEFRELIEAAKKLRG